MIRTVKEPMYRLKPILKGKDDPTGIIVVKSYRLQKRWTFGSLYLWINYRSTGLINVEDNADQLENFVEHLTQTIYLNEDASKND